MSDAAPETPPELPVDDSDARALAQCKALLAAADEALERAAQCAPDVSQRAIALARINLAGRHAPHARRMIAGALRASALDLSRLDLMLPCVAPPCVAPLGEALAFLHAPILHAYVSAPISGGWTYTREDAAAVYARCAENLPADRSALEFSAHRHGRMSHDDDNYDSFAVALYTELSGRLMREIYRWNGEFWVFCGGFAHEKRVY